MESVDTSETIENPLNLFLFGYQSSIGKDDLLCLITIWDFDVNRFDPSNLREPLVNKPFGEGTVSRSKLRIDLSEGGDLEQQVILGAH